MQNMIRDIAGGLPAGWLSRRLRPIFVRLSGGKTARVADIDVFGSQKARLYPMSNLSDKRVYCMPQLWDRRERTILAEAIRSLRDPVFNFLDVGANVGLYSLFARSEAQRAGNKIAIACVEPGPAALARLRYHQQLNQAGDIKIFPYAATETAQSAVLFANNASNIGESSLIGDGGEGTEVEGRCLADIIAEAGFDTVHAMKIDIEGAELPALKGLYNNAPPSCWPVLVIMETPRGADGSSPLEQLCLAKGYRLLERTRMNSVYKRDSTNRADVS